MKCCIYPSVTYTDWQLLPHTYLRCLKHEICIQIGTIIRALVGVAFLTVIKQNQTAGMPRVRGKEGIYREGKGSTWG